MLVVSRHPQMLSALFVPPLPPSARGVYATPPLASQMRASQIERA
jgi:hypothetical protein